MNVKVESSPAEYTSSQQCWHWHNPKDMKILWQVNVGIDHGTTRTIKFFTGDRFSSSLLNSYHYVNDRSIGRSDEPRKCCIG